MTDTIVISCHHRRSRFFEETITALWEHGYKEIWIQDTGGQKLGKFQGPFSDYMNINQRSYDQGMMSFRDRIPNKKLGRYRNILMLDNDCFCTPEAVDKFVASFEKHDYGWASHLVSAPSYKDHWTFEDNIAEVFDQKMLASKQIPGFVPEPHYENCFSLMKTDVWRQIPAKNFSHSRLMLKAIDDLDEKMGAHKAEYRFQYSHFGEGWFHVGNLMRFYYFLENNDYSIFKPENRVPLSRLGYFFHHGRFLQPRLNDAGIKRLAVDHWNELIDGTVMSGWK